MNDLVKINADGQPMASSRDIAEHFGKYHKDVLESIKNLVAENSAAKSMFHETTFENRGKQYPMYLMNRDGFALLAMGFTGKAALEWKIKYIEAFNDMEQRIKTGKLPKSRTDPAVSAKRVQVMELNARSRVAAQMLKLWTDAGVAPQYQAVAMQGYYPNLSLPREALAEQATAMLDATTIAVDLGIFSKSGAPHAQAVTAIIKKLGELAADEYAMTPYSRNGHDGTSIQYSAAVERKVAHWLETNKYPGVISDSKKNYSVRYRDGKQNAS